MVRGSVASCDQLSTGLLEDLECSTEVVYGRQTPSDRQQPLSDRDPSDIGERPAPSV